MILFLVCELFCCTSSVLAETDPAEALRMEALRQTQSIRQGGYDWPTTETEFFIIHFQPTMEPGSVATDALDLFVSQTLGLWNSPDAFKEELQQNKLAYYLCDDATVTRLTGYQTKGMADLAGRAVISSHFPHFHELAHLLVHLTFDHPPAQTHPLVQEGIACLLGGRWGRSADTVLYTGWVHRNFGMGDLADVLTQEDFFACSGGADVAYSLGAMLCETVRRQAGWEGVLELNRQLSGSLEKVAALEADAVLGVIAAVCGWDMDNPRKDLLGTMDQLWPEYRRCGISPASAVSLAQPKFEISEEKGRVVVWQEDDLIRVKVTAGEFPVYLLSPPITEKRGQSPLFNEHIAGKNYQGQHYGLRCSPDNISLYDFSTNQLVATWVAGFTDELDACGTGTDGLVFEISDQFTGALSAMMAAGCEIW